jgi:mRNA-degrading endonuclease RelE of RelBE toxin-antitoxin system
MARRFAVKFTSEALQEYRELDNSIVNEVNKALEELESRADEIGKRLGNKREINLTGIKERKFASSGVRIIFQITGRQVDVLPIVEILLVDFKKNEADMYAVAAIRLDKARVFGKLDDQDPELYWNPPPALTQADLTQPSMIDQIFDDSFDNIEEGMKQVILDLFYHGDIVAAYEIWRQYHGK